MQFITLLFVYRLLRRKTQQNEKCYSMTIITVIRVQLRWARIEHTRYMLSSCVRLSVRHKPGFELVCGMEASFHLFHTVQISKFGFLQKLGHFPLKLCSKLQTADIGYFCLVLFFYTFIFMLLFCFIRRSAV